MKAKVIKWMLVCYHLWDNMKDGSSNSHRCSLYNDVWQIVCEAAQFFFPSSRNLTLRLWQLIEECHLRQLHHGMPLLPLQGTCQFMTSDSSAAGKPLRYTFLDMPKCLEVEGVVFLQTWASSGSKKSHWFSFSLHALCAKRELSRTGEIAQWLRVLYHYRSTESLSF